jgi:hypothetical protein
MSLSTLVARFSAALTPECDWLKGVPVNVGNVVEVGDAARLETLCHEWEKRSEYHPEETAFRH